MLDFAQLVSSMTKLDVGYDGRVLLSSAQEGTLLLVSYKDLKVALDRSFDEVASLAVDAGGD